VLVYGTLPPVKLRLRPWWTTYGALRSGRMTAGDAPVGSGAR
jgi:hypothetical protein